MNHIISLNDVTKASNRLSPILPLTRDVSKYYLYHLGPSPFLEELIPFYHTRNLHTHNYTVHRSHDETRNPFAIQLLSRLQIQDPERTAGKPCTIQNR